MPSRLPNSLRITVFPRIHFGLLSMSSEGYRLNGGIGAAITAPQAIVQIRDSKVFCIKDSRDKPFDSSELNRLKQCLIRGLGQYGVHHTPLSITISGPMPSHCGFGSATSIRLACLEGAFLKRSIKVPRSKLIELSGRGGTSGIGVSTYFRGGLVLDVGRRGGKLAPSSALENRRSLPLTFCKISMPRWPAGIFLAPNAKGISGSLERKFFSSHANLNLRDVEKAAHIALFGIVPSAVEQDLSAFCRALSDMQTTRWKRAEWALHGASLDRARKILLRNGAESVALSSLGPCLIFMGPDVRATIKELRQLFPEGTLNLAHMRNGGRMIRYE